MWAKMKFFPTWPAKLKKNVTVRAESYNSKKMILPKLDVEFIDEPT